MNTSRGVRGVVVAACDARYRGRPAGSDSALLAAIASDRHSSLVVIRSGLNRPMDHVFAGCRLRFVTPTLGRPSMAGPLVRREFSNTPVPVWAEDRDAEVLRGFARAAVVLGENEGADGYERVIESIRGSAENSRTPSDEATIVVLTSHPSRLDARSIIFVTSLASVAGRGTRAIMPRGTRNVPSGSRYIRRLGFHTELSVFDGPSWMAMGRADAVLVDLEYEGTTRFGPALVGLAQAMDLPVIDVPGMMAVGSRDARVVGQPLVEALITRASRRPDTDQTPAS